MHSAAVKLNRSTEGNNFNVLTQITQKMKKLTVAFVRSVIDQQFKEEISYSRMVELLNEEVNSEPCCDCVPEPREEIGSYTAWHCERCRKEIPEPVKPKSTIFKRDECIFQYCPHPDLCKNNCQNNRHG